MLIQKIFDELNMNKSNNILLKTADKLVNVLLAPVPAGQSLYEMIKEILAQSKDYIRNEQEKRFIRFHEAILKGNHEDNYDLSDAYIDQANYSTLLNACLQDIESEKVDFYAELTKNIARNKIPQEFVRPLILNLKEFSFQDIDDMRRSYVCKKYRIRSYPGSSDMKIELLPSIQEFHEFYGRNLMELRGLCKNGELTEFGDIFLESCLDKNKLTPISCDMEEWKNNASPILIISNSVTSDKVISDISNIANKLNFAGYKIGAITRIDYRSSKLIPKEIVLFFIDENIDDIISNLKYIKHFLGKNCIAIVSKSDYLEKLELIISYFNHIIIKNEIADDVLAEEILKKIEAK